MRVIGVYERLNQRFPMSKQLAGIVEMDETWFKYSEKGSRGLLQIG